MIIRHASQLLNTQRNVRGPCTVIIIPIFNNSSGNLHMILNCLYARSTEYARGAVQWYVSGTRAPNWCKIDKSIWFVHAQMVTWNIIFHNKTRNCKDKRTQYHVGQVSDTIISSYFGGCLYAPPRTIALSATFDV